MKTKKKLTLGLGLLLVLIVLLALFGIRQINSLASDTENILKDNYKTLDYARNMLKLLSEFRNNPELVHLFEDYLTKQKNNITEAGEKELTANLLNNFYQLKENPNDTTAAKYIRSDLFEIIRLNLEAVHHKSSIATKTSEHAVLWISLLGTFCFLIAMGLFVTLPGNISRPIEELIESIKQIATNNYSQKVNFENHYEFGGLAKAFNTMVEKLEEFNQSNLSKLIAGKKITETLINKIHDPIIGFDKNMKVIFVNEEFLKIAKLELNDIVEKDIASITAENKIIETVSTSALNKTIAGSQITIENGNNHKYFEKETVEILYTPVGEETERLMGHVIILKNITKFKELDLAKTNFIATVSHELKTPISSIKFSLQLLENEKTGKTNDAQNELIKSIEDDTNHLLKIIGELLNLAQVESGNIQLSIRPSDSVKILTYAMEANRAQAMQKNITFRTNWLENLPKVLADSEKTTWVLTNIISNAIRYSPDNASIFLAIAAENNKIKISVRDEGPGIPPQYNEKIFNKYFQVPGSKKEGTGLGLAISKEFIEAQGGKIKLESTSEKGSTFVVILNSV